LQLQNDKPEESFQGYSIDEKHESTDQLNAYLIPLEKYKPFVINEIEN